VTPQEKIEDSTDSKNLGLMMRVACDRRRSDAFYSLDGYVVSLSRKVLSIPESMSMRSVVRKQDVVFSSNSCFG